MSRASSDKPIQAPPATFDGTLEDLYLQHIAPVLPDVDVVLDPHRALEDYIASPDPVFLGRYLGSP